MFGDTKEVIVCAAIRKDELIILGIRHFDDFMRKQISQMLEICQDWEQGFMTNKSRFVTRDEAWTIAQARDQLRWGKDRSPGPLFSEDLY
jgi:hypothetical protein